MSRDYDRENDRDDDDDDWRDRERYSRRKQSSNRSVLLIVGGIGCAIFLVCGGLLAVGMIWGFKAFTKELPLATATANQFLDRLQQNDIDGAYDLTSSEFRSSTTKEQFVDFLKQFEMFGKHTSRTVNSSNIFQNPSGTQVVIKLLLQSPNNAMNCTLVLVREQDVWKVLKLTVP